MSKSDSRRFSFQAGSPRPGNQPKSGSSLETGIQQNIVDLDSNIQTISALILQFGTERDTQMMRSNLHDLTTKTESIIKNTNVELQQLASSNRSLKNKLQQDFTIRSKKFQDLKALLQIKKQKYPHPASQTSYYTTLDMQPQNDEERQLKM
eukprot:TRINITY_DN5891_c0_g1_i1.p1 TRINITY_DN5891_c0_g1~~TRINITY_DN5891_c0_g1_i1.p1  ORF type:complete len:151 (-),score=34.36 TRINITY_DN5891_c0_g1_i1:63-515(-)